MSNDKHVMRMWRKLFRGQEITSETTKEAHNLLNELGPESPLKIRLAQELTEIKALEAKKKVKGK